MIGLGKRISYAARCFFSVLSRGEVPEDIAPEVTKTPAQVVPAPAQVAASSAPPVETRPLVEMPPPEDSSDRALQMLALLQRDGRLIDFFQEDITPYQDEQIGAAVREMHANCRKVLDQYVKLEPILAGEEDRPFTVEAGFDPASVKLLGNVSGQLPLRGVLRHRGWRVTTVKLPPLAAQGAGRNIVAPAEVEIP